MAEFVTLTCPSCSGKLKITNDVHRFACGHCGNEHIVKREDGIVAISVIVDKLGKIQHGTDKTASELAIKRLNVEIPELKRKIEKFATLHCTDTFYQEYEKIVNKKKLKSIEYDLIIVELEKELARKKKQYTEGGKPPLFKKLYTRQWEDYLKEFKNGLEKYKSFVNALKEKQLQLTKHKNIVA